MRFYRPRSFSFVCARCRKINYQLSGRQLFCCCRRERNKNARAHHTRGWHVWCSISYILPPVDSFIQSSLGIHQHPLPPHLFFYTFPPHLLPLPLPAIFFLPFLLPPPPSPSSFPLSPLPSPPLFLFLSFSLSPISLTHSPFLAIPSMIESVRFSVKSTHEIVARVIVQLLLLYHTSYGDGDDNIHFFFVCAVE